MELKDKGAVLKSYEAFCYRIAYFLLQNETAAVSAALFSLKELLHGDEFFHFDTAGQRELLKTVTIRQCLSLKREAAAAAVENSRATVKM